MLMSCIRRHCTLFLALLGGALPALDAEPLALHPENPHYFLWRDKPTVLVTSGEHYGAVLNLDFDFRKYLDTLKRDGLNLTRTFAGAYCEDPGAFDITANTLAPRPNRFITPWARSAEPGYADGGNKFDLSRWDPAYFARLREFMRHADRRGVVVEMNLFCPFYDDSMWNLSPMNVANNVNGVGTTGRTNAYTVDRSGGLLPYQEAMVRKLVTELRDFDNLYYEICNEPYFGGVTLEWQHRMAEMITRVEEPLRVRHLISQNIANGSQKIVDPSPLVSIFNFHYASPPDAVALNWHLNKPIGDNETGFVGTNDAPYRIEAWSFMLSGGALFNHLDYSFTVGHENGTFVYPANQPGGGNPGFRHQIGQLKRFLEEINFIQLQADTSFIKGGVPEGHSAYALVKLREKYALYLARAPKGRSEPTTATLQLDLPPGRYFAEWVNPATGTTDKRDRFTHVGGIAQLRSPLYADDTVLKLLRK